MPTTLITDSAHNTSAMAKRRTDADGRMRCVPTFPKISAFSAG